MAKRKAKKAPARKAGRKTAGRGKKTAAEFIISKSRTKNAAGINVSGEFYGALDSTVRGIIKQAEARAVNNGRKTLRPHDL
jgi:histone H3/H4